MSKLKIFTNAMCEIKALRYTEDPSLICHEIDREEVFGNVSDVIILGYKYEPRYDSEGNPTTPIVSPYLDVNQLYAANAGIMQMAAETNNICYVNQVSLEELIAFHKKAINKVMQKIIYSGIAFGGKHYSLSDDDQRNINRLVTKLEIHPEISYVPYHADGESCGMIPRDIMLGIGTLAEAFVFFHTTRVNRLHRMIEACTRKRDVLEIQYDTKLTPALQREVDELYASMQLRGQTLEYLESTIYTGGNVEGEVYSNAGSMIQTPTYVTMTNWCDVSEYTYEKISGNDNTAYRYTLPISIIDDDKIPEPGYGQKDPQFTLSPIFHRIFLTEDHYDMDEEYTPKYTMIYRRNPRSRVPELYMDITDDVVLRVTVPMGALVNSEDDSVNPATDFYIINNNVGHKITTDIEEVKYCVGVVQDAEI